MGLFGSISHTLRHTARVAERQVVRRPPQRRKIPVRTQRQVSRVVSGAVNRAAKPLAPHPRPRPKPARHEYHPISNPFNPQSIKNQGEPFGLAKKLAEYRATGALARSYTPPVAEREYRKFVNQTYKRARSHYPGSTRRTPGMDFADPNRWGLHASVFGVDPHSGKVIPTNKRSVHFTPQDAMAYVLQHGNRGNVAGDVSQFLPLHEWTHVFQRTPAMRSYSRSGLSHALIEGGAQAFAQDLAPRLGLPTQSRASNPGYASLANYVRRTKGRRYIQRGQFGY